ncbi:MAG: hypothetical protein ACK6D1_07655 [Planctomycetota bacterium]
MAQTVAIPGRRVSSGETFRTDWTPRGGDCAILRVEVLIAEGGGKAITFALETRGEDGTTVTTMTPKSPACGLELTSTGVATCLYLATDATTAGNGAQEQVRVVVSCTSDSGGYYVVRIFPLIFFDSAREY